MTLKLTTTYQGDGKFYVGYCVELGVTSQGETLETAEKNLKEAVELYLEDASKDELKNLTQHPLIRTMDIEQV